MIASTIGYEWWSSHRTVRTIAEGLAARGHLVLRFDYDGTGDSAGERWDPDRITAWRSSLRAAVEAVRAQGPTSVSIVGLRFGALLALTDGADLGVASIAAIAPVVSGRRYSRELRLLAEPVPGVEGAVVNAGLVLTQPTIADLGALDATMGDRPPAPRVLVLQRPEQPVDALVEHLRGLGTVVEVQDAVGLETALDIATEAATVPGGLVDAVVDWFGTGPTRATSVEVAPSQPVVADIPVEDGVVRESIVELGGLVAVRSQAPAGPSDTVVVLLDSGSEPHVGPGRSWVDYARTLARRGVDVLRIDYSGWGESPDRGHAPGRPYDRHCLEETAAMVRQLRADYDHVVLAGLCVGAWMGIRVAQTTSVDAVVAINPQLYWDYGEPLDPTIAETVARRTGDRARNARYARLGVWSALDALGIRPRGARWLSGLRHRRTPTLLLFAEGDEAHLRSRPVRAAPRSRAARRVPGVDRGPGDRPSDVPRVAALRGRRPDHDLPA